MYYTLCIPNELFIYILSNLDCATLLKCTQVCKLFNKLINGTATLQLIIELHATGQEDGPTNPSLSPANRLDLLKKHQIAWNGLKWTKEHYLPMLNGSLWELYGGVLAQSSSIGDITFHQLPSKYRSLEENEWTVGSFDFIVRDFGMDPSQDLLVLVENPRWSGSNPDHMYRFHLRTMSTGDPHPLVYDAAVICYPQVTPDSQSSYTIQISEGSLGVLFHSTVTPEAELVVWEWKSGAIEVALFGYELQSFAFLTECHIIMALLTIPEEDEEVKPSLLVLNFRQESNQRHTVKEAQHASLFYYPRLDTYANPISIEIRSDPVPSWAPNPNSTVPFHIAWYNRLFVISLRLLVRNRLRCAMLFVPLATFLEHLRCNNTEPEQIVNKFEWPIWGPRGARLLVPRIPPSEIWVCYVNGSRYVALGKNKKQITMEVYDFNQIPLLRTVKEEVGPRNSTDYVDDVNLFKAGVIFADEIGTSLPYRIQTLPLDLRSILHVAVMCSEDNLIVVHSDENRRKYQILTF